MKKKKKLLELSPGKSTKHEFFKVCLTVRTNTSFSLFSDSPSKNNNNKNGGGGGPSSLEMGRIEG